MYFELAAGVKHAVGFGITVDEGYGTWLDASGIPSAGTRAACAARSPVALKLLTPIARICPARCAAAIARSNDAAATKRGGQWIWYRSIRPSRARLRCSADGSARARRNG